MPEMSQRLSALASAYRPGRHGAHEGAAGIRLSERRPLSIVQIAGFDADSAKRAESAAGLPLGAAKNRSAQQGGSTVLWAGSLRWLVVSDGEADLARRLADAIGGAAAVTDLSQARTTIRVAGPASRTVLAKGCGVDLHPRVFPVGSCAVTSVAKIAAHIHLVDAAPTIDVMIYRGYGLSFWEWLTESAAEFGYEAA